MCVSVGIIGVSLRFTCSVLERQALAAHHAHDSDAVCRPLVEALVQHAIETAAAKQHEQEEFDLASFRRRARQQQQRDTTTIEKLQKQDVSARRLLDAEKVKETHTQTQ